jgi:hypothetical protein
MISLALFSVAAILNAFMDRVENSPAYNTSIFRNLQKSFWCKEFSWRRKYKGMNVENGRKKFLFIYLDAVSDAWHIAKMLMIISICGAAVFYKPILGIWDIGLLGIVWNVTFSLFYDKLFKKEPPPPDPYSDDFIIV